MSKKRYKCDIGIQNFAILSKAVKAIRKTLDDHERRLAALEPEMEVPVEDPMVGHVLGELFFSAPRPENNHIIMTTSALNSTYADEDVVTIFYDVAGERLSVTDTLAHFAAGVYVTEKNPETDEYESYQAPIILADIEFVSVSPGLRYHAQLMVEEELQEEEEPQEQEEE